MPRALVVSPEGLRVAAHPDPAVTAEMLREMIDVRLAGLAGDQARDHGAGDQAARDHDVARAALDDAARDDAALDHDLRAGRDAGHHLLVQELYTLHGSAGSIVRAAARDSNFCAPFT